MTRQATAAAVGDNTQYIVGVNINVAGEGGWGAIAH